MLGSLRWFCGSTQETEADGGKDGSNFSGSLQTFYITLFYVHTASAGGWEDRLPGATPSWAGELGEILPKAKAAVYKHLIYK